MLAEIKGVLQRGQAGSRAGQQGEEHGPRAKSVGSWQGAWCGREGLSSALGG